MSQFGMVFARYAAMSLRNLVHCALCLAVAFAGLAAFYLQLGAAFVGAAAVVHGLHGEAAFLARVRGRDELVCEDGRRIVLGDLHGLGAGGREDDGRDDRAANH